MKYLNYFLRTLELPLINCGFKLNRTWTPNCVISASTGAATFAVIDTKLYLPIVTLSTQDNEKMLQELKPGFKQD